MQHLQLATNWLLHRRNGAWVDPVAAVLLPLAHQLFVPAMKAHDLMRAVVGLLHAASLHDASCALLTRTCAMPGVGLSSSRSSRPLLAALTATAAQQLGRWASCPRTDPLMREEPLQLLVESLTVLQNCARQHECFLVMMKCDLVKTLMGCLATKKAIAEDASAVVPAVLRLVFMLSHQPEAQTAVCKAAAWSSTLLAHLTHPRNHIFALLLASNLARNHHAAQGLLASEPFVRLLLAKLNDDPHEPQEVSLVLSILWGLLANNKRSQALLKRYPVAPLVHHVKDALPSLAELCSIITQILGA